MKLMKLKLQPDKTNTNTLIRKTFNGVFTMLSKLIKYNMNDNTGITKKKKEGGCRIVKSCFQTYSVNYVFQLFKKHFLFRILKIPRGYQ